MQFIPAILNIFIVILFVRLIARPDRETFFNPFVAYVNNRVNRLTDFLKPALGLPEQAVVGLLMIFTFLLKTLLTLRLDLQTGVDFGEAFRCLPPDGAQKHAALLLFSLLGTVSFILKFWCFHFLASLIADPSRLTRAAQTLDYYARPFSKLPFVFRPFLLIGCHMVLAFVAVNAGTLTTNALQPGAAFTTTEALSASPLPIAFIKTAALGALSFFEGISVMISALFTFIIGSLLGALFQKPGIVILCREGTDLILGRFSRSRTGRTGLDFTPLFFFIAANLIYNMANVFVLAFVNLQFTLPFS